VLATLIRVPRDFDLAEEALHEAFRSTVEIAEGCGLVEWALVSRRFGLYALQGAIAAPFDTAFSDWSPVSQRASRCNWSRESSTCLSPSRAST